MPDSSWIDYYPESYWDGQAQGCNETEHYFGQTITGDGRTLDEVKFWLKRALDPTGNAYVQLYPMAVGTFGLNGRPANPVADEVDRLAESDPVDITTISSDTWGLVSFHFSTPYTLVAGTHYCIIIKYTGGDATHQLGVGIDFTPNFHAGNNITTSAGNWGGSTSIDNIFYAISDQGGSTLVKKIIAQCG